MDCEEFLREIKECQRINGLDAPEGPLFFLSASVFRANKFDWVEPNPRPRHESSEEWMAGEAFWATATLPNVSCFSRASPPALKQKIRAFVDFRDMVYTLAWELSTQIGRLPDSLHARMVLSADGHPMVRRYVEEWGV